MGKNRYTRVTFFFSTGKVGMELGREWVVQERSYFFQAGLDFLEANNLGGRLGKGFPKAFSEAGPYTIHIPRCKLHKNFPYASKMTNGYIIELRKYKITILCLSY